MPQAVLSIRGNHRNWAITTAKTNAQITAMREDGVDVGILEHSIPAWVVDAGLLRPWCWWQSMWWNISNRER